jgi:hypothetical protein
MQIQQKSVPNHSAKLGGRQMRYTSNRQNIALKAAMNTIAVDHASVSSLSLSARFPFAPLLVGILQPVHQRLVSVPDNGERVRLRVENPLVKRQDRRVAAVAQAFLVLCGRHGPHAQSTSIG